jgi:hypothetical protein
MSSWPGLLPPPCNQDANGDHSGELEILDFHFYLTVMRLSFPPSWGGAREGLVESEDFQITTPLDCDKVWMYNVMPKESLVNRAIEK